MSKTKTIRKTPVMPDMAKRAVPDYRMRQFKMPVLPDPANVQEPVDNLAYTDVKDVQRIPCGFLCSVKFACDDIYLTFQASPKDVEPHGRAIHAECEAGKWGAITDYFPTDAELLAATEERIARELHRANPEVMKYQDRVDTDDASEADIARLKAWKKYRASLNRLSEQEGFPYSLTWPVVPDVEAIAFHASAS